MQILVIDIGGTNVKIWSSEAGEKIKIPSGKQLTAQRFVEQLKSVLGDRTYDRISIGFPGEIAHGRPTAEPYNLGGGWTELDWGNEFKCPLRMMNDACMQALGSYEGGRMLYVGLGTSMGTALVNEGKVISLALGHLKFCRGETFEHYLSRRGLEMHGLKRWNRAAIEAALVLKSAFLADYVMLGGGNAKKLRNLPEGLRRGDNQNAYFGGVRMWEDAFAAESQLAMATNPADSQARAAAS